MKRTRFGVLLPHFGQHARVETVVQTSREIEEMGFDSVWVRDHLIWTPHGEIDGSDPTFLEPLLTLAAISAVTRRILLGTAVLIPVRWPLKLAQELASLSVLSNGRVVAGFGLGGNAHEIAGAGFQIGEREDIFRETLEIIQAIWRSDDVSYEGKIFRVDRVTIRPKPVAPIPLLYGGSTRASVRRAVKYTWGWMPGRIPLATLDDRLALLRRLGAEAGKTMATGVIPLVRIAKNRDDARNGVDVPALARSVDVPEVGYQESKHFVRPPSGEFRTIEDLEGLLMAGDPEDCKREVEKLVAREIDHVVFDLRLDFPRYRDQLRLLAESVLPAFR